jgi:hypothetical protein
VVSCSRDLRSSYNGGFLGIQRGWVAGDQSPLAIPRRSLNPSGCPRTANHQTPFIAFLTREFHERIVPSFVHLDGYPAVRALFVEYFQAFFMSNASPATVLGTPMVNMPISFPYPLNAFSTPDIAYIAWFDIPFISLRCRAGHFFRSLIGRGPRQAQTRYGCCETPVRQ